MAARGVAAAAATPVVAMAGKRRFYEAAYCDTNIPTQKVAKFNAGFGILPVMVRQQFCRAFAPIFVCTVLSMQSQCKPRRRSVPAVLGVSAPSACQLIYSKSLLNLFWITREDTAPHSWPLHA